MNSEINKTHQDKPKLRLFLQIICILFLLGIGFGVARYFISTKPQSKQRVKKEYHEFVKTMFVKKQNSPITIQAMGVVLPAQEIELKSRMSGKVLEQSPSFISGGRFKKGESILKIDDQDLTTTLLQKKEEIKILKAEHFIELGKQKIAKEEISQLGHKVNLKDFSLQLRIPQLKIIQSKINIATSVINKIKLDQKRTLIQAPFNGVIDSRSVNIGTETSPLSTLGHFIGTDEFWIEISLPTSSLKWIDIPQFNSETSSMVKVFNEKSWGKNVFREAKIKQIQPQLDKASRMARVIIAIQDPFSLKDNNLPKLLSNNYVKVEIKGKVIPNILKIPRETLRQNNQIWVMTENKKLKILEPKIIFRAQEKIWIENVFSPNEKLITSKISIPVSGMKLNELKTKGSL